MDKAVVLKNIAVLRLHPGPESEAADEVLHGMAVYIERVQDGEWLYVRTRYGYHGYLHRDDVVMDSEKAEEWDREDYVIRKMIADVMTVPEYSGSILATLVRGCKVKHTEETCDKWEKVGLADGSFGWLRRGFAGKLEKLSTVENEETLRANIVKTALDYINCQYRWGGKTPLGIDCSGLSSMAYMLNGIVIPRDSDMQQKYLKPISREEAKPGDLFFFPGHVAVCIGDGRYVHSTGREGYVVINSFNPESSEYREDLDKNQSGTGTIFF